MLAAAVNGESGVFFEADNVFKFFRTKGVRIMDSSEETTAAVVFIFAFGVDGDDGNNNAGDVKVADDEDEDEDEVDENELFLGGAATVLVVFLLLLLFLLLFFVRFVRSNCLCPADIALLFVGIDEFKPELAAIRSL